MYRWRGVGITPDVLEQVVERMSAIGTLKNACNAYQIMEGGTARVTKAFMVTSTAEPLTGEASDDHIHAPESGERLIGTQGNVLWQRVEGAIQGRGGEEVGKPLLKL
jgi:hypothetical protein